MRTEARGRHLLAAGALAAAAVTSACLPDKDKEPDWHKAPKAFDPAGADLTFNKDRLEAFNTLDTSKQEAHVAELKSTAGSFKGHAIFKRGTELGDKMDDLVYGRHEIYALAPGPDTDMPEGILFEINIEYHLFSEENFYTGWPSGSYVEFTGTLADMHFQSEAKPRKMELKVKVDSVNLIKD